MSTSIVSEFLRGFGPEPRPDLREIADLTSDASVPLGEDIAIPIKGFGPMTRIETSFGKVPAAALRENDRVRTRSGDFRPIEVLDRIILGEGFVSCHKGVLPIVIRAGALGPNLPENEISLAPYQTISKNQMTAGGRSLRAIDALKRPLVFRKPELMITYTVFHCGSPTSINCEGLWLDVAP